MVHSFWRKVRETVVETAYPRTCAGCGMRGTWLCRWCVPTVPRLEDACCPRCEFPIAGKRCRACRDLDPRIHLAIAAYPFAGWAGESVRLLKYSSEWGRAESMGGLMTPAAVALGPVDVVVPVPLHHQKLALRGYNQSSLLAATVAASLGVPMIDGLERRRPTTSQVTLDRERRRTNMLDAFIVSADWIPATGLRIMLVDDVRTTSATINACVQALDILQPASIACLTFALDIPARELESWLSAVRPKGRQSPRV